MEKITPDSPDSKSADLVAENRHLVAELLPQAFPGGELDLDVLAQLLGGSREEQDERYGINWHGRRRSRQRALTPSLGTLRPAEESSVDWNETKNIFIEGDNQEVLKLLQRSYANKIKFIYIDPPYNTGGDFVYNDDFIDPISHYLMVTGQKGDDGNAVSSNVESSGRFHTNWLNMIYPRLLLARNLLCEDGCIFISIDDGEVAALRLVCDSIFGEDNFIATFIWKSRQNKDNRTVTGASTDHEYILAYGRGIRGSGRNTAQYTNPDNDLRGPWASGNMVGLATSDRRPNLHYDLIDPKTGINYGCPRMGWRYDRRTMGLLIEEGRIIWPPESVGRPRRKVFLKDLGSEFAGFSTFVGGGLFTRNGTADVEALFGFRAFSFPKPVDLIASFIEQTTGSDDYVLDFFAGSGTTAHAVMRQNALDGGTRRFILVQLPEPLDPANPEQKTAAQFCADLDRPANIAELTMERLRRAGKQVKAAAGGSGVDVGFRTFRLDSTNIRDWCPESGDVAASLEASIEHLRQERTDADVLFEILIKLGFDLSAQIEQQTHQGKTVYAIGAGTLIACLDRKIARPEVAALGQGIVSWHKALSPAGETQVVFRDSAFEDDIAKTNMAAILQQNGLENVRSI